MKESIKIKAILCLTLTQGQKFSAQQHGESKLYWNQSFIWKTPNSEAQKLRYIAVDWETQMKLFQNCAKNFKNAAQTNKNIEENAIRYVM